LLSCRHRVTEGVTPLKTLQGVSLTPYRGRIGRVNALQASYREHSFLKMVKISSDSKNEKAIDFASYLRFLETDNKDETLKKTKKKKDKEHHS
jgi:hypothetical protein